MRALKPIRAGEQITMSYIGGPLVSRAERQEELQGKYAFTCACPACSSSLDEIQRSDGRRSILGTLKSDVDHDPAIRKWVADVSLQDDMFLAPYLRLMGYFEAETYADADAWPGVLQRLVKVYCALGNAEEARKVARKAACLTMVFTGDDGGWTKVADAPEKTTWWGLRAKAKEAARCANH
ncbi:hypothetical protein EW146_g6242 [Bondarzewia mesenterica]|uniref:SET domain-containing protein n=1 Tax=Bondarzewia mesenterica TaxID=1095465 RepID=A0A4S4LPS4_9AGAM|nr:hypothetical protein EW146_g6242 [Bondarzewia mesenterica]